jgi:hypothetical protein
MISSAARRAVTSSAEVVARTIGAFGRDTLNGGRGRDECDGGAGKDEKINCER